MNPKSFYQLLFPLVLLVACSNLSSAPTPTSTTIFSTETPTTTIVWFPPTNTPTSFPTQMIPPTPDQRPGLGSLLFSDSFDQPELWNTVTSSSASAKVDRNRLTLSISAQGPIYLTSLRSQPTLGNSYAEAMVKLSLCAGMDQFGMVIRATPGNNYYRFTVTCNGQMRLERVSSGSTMPLRDWLTSGDAPIAAPAEVKLGVWAVGNEMRLFINDNYQFAIRDPMMSGGTIGFFVYANGATPITVSFSNLFVYTVAYVSPTPTLESGHTPNFVVTATP
jgi:hypothetical protein